MNPYHAAAISIRDDLVRALKSAKPEFEAIPVTPRGHRAISAMSLDLHIQHGYAQVSLRTSSEKRTDPRAGGWQLAGFLSSLDGPCDREMRRIAKTVKAMYSQVPMRDLERLADRRHMLFLAAAEAIMDEQVVEVLNTYLIDAPFFGDDLGNHPFTFFVCDEDENLAANYCDIVRGHRVTARILRGEV